MDRVVEQGTASWELVTLGFFSVDRLLQVKHLGKPILRLSVHEMMVGRICINQGLQIMITAHVSTFHVIPMLLVTAAMLR